MWSVVLVLVGTLRLSTSLNEDQQKTFSLVAFSKYKVNADTAFCDHWGLGLKMNSIKKKIANVGKSRSDFIPNSPCKLFLCTLSVFRSRLTSVANSERRWVLQTPHQTPTEYCMRHFLLLRRQPIQFQPMWQVCLTASSPSRFNCSMICLLALRAMIIKCFSQRHRLHGLTTPLTHAL